MTTAPSRRALPPAQIERHLERLSAWRWDTAENCIVKSWTFDSFRNLMACLMQIAEIAERLDHHPHITTCYT
ncbi:MAG: 4a-hydroxytetrahydrobiopterin dehydratase, partial [Betaproteobacteria bacterium]|nr:4a-hydroxytetrahydrobiopterin dehydratase [Betaproteobacteria bacterium]